MDPAPDDADRGSAGRGGEAAAPGDVPDLARQLDILRVLPDTIEAAIRTGRTSVPVSLSAELDAAMGPVRTDVRRLREDLAAALDDIRETTTADTPPVGVDLGRIEDLLGRLTDVLDAHMDSHRRLDAVDEKLERALAMLGELATRLPADD